MDKGSFQNHPVLSLFWLLWKYLPLCFEVQNRRISKGRRTPTCKRGKEVPTSSPGTGMERKNRQAKGAFPSLRDGKDAKSPRKEKNVLFLCCLRPKTLPFCLS